MAAAAAAAAVAAAAVVADPSLVSPSHFEVIDALGGATRLIERSPTLDGSLPLRVVQGCVPFLDGNAWGLQVSLPHAWRARRSLTRWRVEPVAHRDLIAQWGLPRVDPSPDVVSALDARVRAAITTLTARGWLSRDSAWARTITGVVSACSSPSGAVVRVFTGLLVKPSKGCVLRVARAANRRSLAYDVAETYYADDDRFTPLVVDLIPTAGVSELRVEGEVATLSAHPRRRGVAHRELEAMPEIGRRHLDFYDAAYFEQKKRGEVTRKYRRSIAVDRESDVEGDGETVIVTASPGSFDIERSVYLASPDGISRGDAPVDTVSFANEIAFTARWDGARVTIEWDRSALDARASAIQSRWRALYPDVRGREGEGALLYLTRYFTPHPAGEPHFFTKPASFVVTPKGWSSMVEGVPGERYDVLRGVVRTDSFHAAPAVFALGAPCEIKVSAGRPLVRAMPTPRSMTLPMFTSRSLDEVLPP